MQVPSKPGDDKLITVGKADVDLSRHVTLEGTAQSKMIPIIFKVGTTTTGYLKVSITTEMVKGGVDDDGMTEVSAMTGVTSSLELNEQDLSGEQHTQLPRGESCAGVGGKLCWCRGEASKHVRHLQLKLWQRRLVGTWGSGVLRPPCASCSPTPGQGTSNLCRCCQITCCTCRLFPSPCSCACRL